MPDFNPLAPNPGTSGLLMGLDPAYQARQLQNQQSQIGLDAARAFRGGLPTDASGNVDYGAAANRLLQLGDFGSGEKLLQAQLQIGAIAAAQRNAASVGTWGGGPQPAAPGDAQGAGGPMPAGDAPAPYRGPAVSKSANPEVIKFIATTASSMGIDPQYALRVAASEGLNGFDPSGNANLGDAGSSAGPFQLHYGNVAPGGNSAAGLGDDFTAATRLDARDPSTWKQQVVFALQNAARNGWGAFHGAANSGIGRWDGINRDGATAGAAAVPTFARGLVATVPQAGTPAPARPGPPPPGGALSAISFAAPGAATTAVGAPPSALSFSSSDAAPPAAGSGGSATARLPGAGPALPDPPPEIAASIARMRSGQSTEADRTAYLGWAMSQRNASPGTVDGHPAGDGETPPGRVHPYGAPPAAPSPFGALRPPPGPVPAPIAGTGAQGPAAQPRPAGAAAPISFGGPGAPDGGDASLRQPPPVPTVPTRPPALPAATSTAPPGLIDPSFAGQVPDAWLKAGYTAGQWVSYARQQAALNSSLPFGAGKGNADAWNSIADGLARSIDKSLEYAPEQRIARDAVTQQWLLARTDAENRSKLAADTDPSRISFAGDEARARAAGTKAGEAPYTFLPSQPNPGGPTVYRSVADVAGDAAQGGPGVVKDQPKVFNEKQLALGKIDTEMQGQFQQRQVARERIDAMLNLLETFQSGAGAEAKAAAIAGLRSVGFNIPDSVTGNPAAVEQISKNATGAIFDQAKAIGGRVLVTELDGLKKANAGPNLQPGSNAGILAQQKGILDWEDAHYRAYSAWRNANPYATDASAFETAFARANPVGAYTAAARKDIAPLGLPPPRPDQRVDGQAYLVNGSKVRWSAASGQFVPFSGTTAPNVPGAGDGAQPPVAGARQAPDGHWYISDPRRSGKYLQVGT